MLPQNSSHKAGQHHCTVHLPMCSVAQSWLTLCDPMDCSPPGSSVHGILQARILEWVSMPSSTGPSWPRDQTTSPESSALAGRVMTAAPPGKSQVSISFSKKCETPMPSAHPASDNAMKSPSTRCPTLWSVGWVTSYCSVWSSAWETTTQCQ